MRSNNKTWYSWLLSPWVIFSSLLCGALLGQYFPFVAIHIAFIGKIYISLLQMCIIPLVVTAITTSFAKLMHSKVESHLIRRMVFVFIVSLLLASFIGVICSWAGHIGGNLDESSQNHIGSLLIQADKVVQHHFNSDAFASNVVSSNIFVAFVDGKNISILIFSILLGIALGFVTTKAGKDTLTIFDGLFHTFLTLVNGVMHVLPLGLFALIADQVAQTGFSMLTVAEKLIIYTYVLGIILLLFFIWVLSRRAKIGYFRSFYHLREMLVVAFVSGSSFAALPFGISALINDFKLSKLKVNLFFPLSVCLNPVGTAYFLALVSVFIAHLYGQSLGAHELVLIWILAVLTAVAIGSVPAVAGFSFLTMIFTPLGLPSSTAIVLLIAISNILDPIVTVVNVAGNAMTTSLLSTREETIKEELQELIQ